MFINKILSLMKIIIKKPGYEAPSSRITVLKVKTVLCASGDYTVGIDQDLTEEDYEWEI